MQTPKNLLPLTLTVIALTGCCSVPEPQPVPFQPARLQVPAELLTPARRGAMERLDRLLTTPPSSTPQ